MKNGDNKGFSLVELIIVIAIMAVLIGVLTPIMIKYVEKANISSDQQMLDAIYQATVCRGSRIQNFYRRFDNPLHFRKHSCGF